MRNWNIELDTPIHSTYYTHSPSTIITNIQHNILHNIPPTTTQTQYPYPPTHPSFRFIVVIYHITYPLLSQTTDSTSNRIPSSTHLYTTSPLSISTSPSHPPPPNAPPIHHPPIPHIRPPLPPIHPPQHPHLFCQCPPTHYDCRPPRPRHCQCIRTQTKQTPDPIGVFGGRGDGYGR